MQIFQSNPVAQITRLIDSLQITPDLSLRRAAYVASLKRMDWFFEWSDDHRAVIAGRQALEALRHEQSALDPDYSIWNKHAPGEFRKVVA